MLRILLAVAVLPALAQSGAMRGVVTDAVTKAPVSGAAYWVHSGEKILQTGKSDGQGSFLVEGLAEGSYRLVVRHDDYLPYAGLPFSIRGTAASEWKAELVPLARIAGRVLSPNREPLAGVPVAMRQPWQTEWTQTTTAGADGQFRFARLTPGTWILAAVPGFRFQRADPKSKQDAVPQPEAEEGERTGWATTFYPSATSLADAGKIVLRAGTALEGHDVNLRTVTLRRISGTVIDDAGQPAAKAMVALRDLANRGANSALTTADAEGHFQFDAAMEGDWRLFAQVARGGVTLKGYAEVRVPRQDLPDVSVRLGPPFAAAGVVEREEPRDGEGKRKVTAVYLIPEEASADVQVSAFHAQDGSFVLKNVYRGRYRVLPAGFVPGYYVASVWYGDQEVTSRAIEIADPPLPLRVVYKSGAGRAAGTVDRGDGAWAVLVPQDEALRDSDQFVRMARCGAGGRFSIGSLRPGSYYAFAFDRVQREMFEDVEFVRRLMPRAVRVEVRAGGTADFTLAPEVWPDY